MKMGIARIARGIVLAVCINSFLAVTGCAKKAEQPKGRPPALVMTATASQQNIPVQLKAIGTMEASESVTIKTQVSWWSTITWIVFRLGP